MTSSYWGDQAFGSYSGRVPCTGEYIGPYGTAEELATEAKAAARDWTSELTDTELSAAIEAAGAAANRQYCAGLDTTDIDACLDELMAEAERRRS